MASAAVIYMGYGSSHGQATAYVQTSSGALTGIAIDSRGAITSRFVSWYNAGE